MKKIFLKVVVVSMVIFFSFAAYSLDSALKNAFSGKTLSAEKLVFPVDVKKFYKARDFDLLWMQGGHLSREASERFSAIGKIDEDGLPIKMYHSVKLGELVDKKELTVDEVALTDILLTDAFFAAAVHLQHGVLDPYTFRKNTTKNTDVATMLTQAFASNTVLKTLEALPPADGQYQTLKKAYASYKKKYSNVTWPTVPKGKKIKTGDDDLRVPVLRERLGVAGTGTVFDEKLSVALQEFQRMNGLLDDGVLGDNSVVELNVQPQKRICQIAAALDRLRGYAADMRTPKHIIVNIPDFYARLYVDGSVAWESKAIVGRIDRKSPLLADQVEYIVLNPKWRVPVKIAVEDKIPHIAEDPEFIAKNHMKVFEKVDGELKEVSAASVDWQNLNKDNFNYLIVQDPGDDNALGRIKFMFPNSEDVYLHDTPSKKLFESTTRTFSSGCIRVQRPVALAEYLLANKEGWNKERISTEMKKSKEVFVYLDKPLPIMLIYLTSWADPSGTLEFRRDVYSYDRQYARVLCD